MKLKPWQFRLMMNWYPPLRFNGIRIMQLSEDYQHMTVRIKKGLLNKNLQGSLFGGSLFSAFDPYYPVMLWQILAKEGIRTQAWLRAAEINYIYPAKSDMVIQFDWADHEVILAKEQLYKTGKYKGWHYAKAKDKDGITCVTCRLLVVLKSKEHQGTNPGF